MNKRLLGLTVCIAAGCSSAQSQATPESVPHAVVAPTANVGPLVDADPGYAGVVLPSVVADLAPTYEGKLETVTVAVGQRVEKGATVATFDPAAAREALAIARAEVRVAKGRAGQAAAASRHARQQLATERDLYQQGISAANNVSQAQADRAQAGAATSSAAGEIAAAKARVEQLERQLTEMSLAAPFAGTVAAVYREAGSLASPAGPVVRLIGTDRSFVRFAIPPEELATMGIGHKVVVALEWAGEPLSGVVRDIAPEIDAPTGLVFVEAELDAASVARAVPNSPVWVRRESA